MTGKKSLFSSLERLLLFNRSESLVSGHTWSAFKCAARRTWPSTKETRWTEQVGRSG